MGTLIVALILALIVGAIIAKMIIDKRKGKSASCGGNCAGCNTGCANALPSGAGHSQNGNGSVKTVVHIDGMMCPMCETHINDAIRNAFKVQLVKSSHKTGICEIVSSEPIDEDELRRTIEATGYRVIINK